MTCRWRRTFWLVRPANTVGRYVINVNALTASWVVLHMFLPIAVLTTVLVSNSVVSCLKFCDLPNSSLLRVIGGSIAAPGLVQIAA